MIQATTSTFVIMLFCGLKFDSIQCDASQPDKDSSSSAIAELTLGMGKCFQSEENQFFSAFSLSTALAMLNEGANGNTKSQISTALHFNSFSVKDVYKSYAEIYSEQSTNYTLDLANRLFAQDGFSILPTYLSVLNDYFLAPLQLVDYKNQPEEAAKTINNFINNATEGLIPNMLPENAFVGSDTVLTIVNAIYFRGFWVYKFNSSITQSEDFTTSNGQKVSTQIMQQLGKFNYEENVALDCKVLQLEYEGGNISMTIILPNKYDGIVNLLNTISASDLVNYVKKATLMATKVDVKLPKFKFEKTYDDNLADCLKGLGIVDVFSSTADLTGIATGTPLAVGKVIQKAVIEVDEEGSKAAAATIIGVVALASVDVPEEPKTFYATNPFIFLISDSRTDAILFSGVVMKPE